MKRLLLLVLIAGLSYLWWEWDHLAMKPRAEDWQPPVGAAPDTAPLPRQPCANRNPKRQAFFGDLHIHTAYSFDARSRDMLGTVDDAYRFARGEPIMLGPFNEAQVGTRPARLQVALDFAAVTDHAEWIGEVTQCSTPGMKAYNSPSCQSFRGDIEVSGFFSEMISGGQGSRMIELISPLGRKREICGEDSRDCRMGLETAWQDTQRAAEQYYDRSSDCSFTTFHGYEYSNSPGRSKVHRNIIFRNEIVPELPISSLEEPNPFRLWEKMDVLCNSGASACDALSIPHNSNVSNGRLFRVPWRDEPMAKQQRLAALRARWEPLVEIIQVKGESECAPGFWQVLGEDELCDFEKIRRMNPEPVEDCQDDYSSGAIMGNGCQSRLDFARYALIEGMVEKERIGINPYQFGFIGGTDTHNASPGDTEEDSYQGCCANTDNNVSDRMDPHKDFGGSPVVARNPGGLMGIWSEENSRDALFDAMRRREVFATSGARIIPRFFAGPDMPTDICTQDIPALAYAAGVAMGGELSSLALEKSPRFVVAASADINSNPLQRLQIVKVWSGENRQFHQAVFDVAGNKNNGASVDLDSCVTEGEGWSQLCTTWTDPNYRSGQNAAYYMRAIENPSCRWSWRQCLELPVEDRPAACSATEVPKVIQERAWTSPIWLTSGGPGTSLAAETGWFNSSLQPSDRSIPPSRSRSASKLTPSASTSERWINQTDQAAKL
jgi:hypothetical protein